MAAAYIDCAGSMCMGMSEHRRDDRIPTPGCADHYWQRLALEPHIHLVIGLPTECGYAISQQLIEIHRLEVSTVQPAPSLHSPDKLFDTLSGARERLYCLILSLRQTRILERLFSDDNGEDIRRALQGPQRRVQFMCDSRRQLLERRSMAGGEGSRLRGSEHVQAVKQSEQAVP